MLSLERTKNGKESRIPDVGEALVVIDPGQQEEQRQYLVLSPTGHH